MQTNILLILANFLLFGFLGNKKNDENNITVAELKNLMIKDSNLVILDVRTPEELNGPLGKISGIINIPIQEFQYRINEMDKYKDKNIAIICRSGNRSATAQRILKQKGFNAKNVSGGMIEYRKIE